MPLFVIAIIYILVPILIMYITEKYTWANKLGAVLIAYILGLVLGNIQILPYSIKTLQDTFTSICVPLAIPLLLFSNNIKQEISRLKTTFISLILGVISIIIPVILGFYFVKNDVSDAWKIAGMLSGVYTGGTPNLASIKVALNVDSETYLLTHTYDMIVSAVFLLFVMSIAQKLLLMFLKPYKSNSLQINDHNNKESLSIFDNWKKKKYIISALTSLGFSILILAMGGGLSMIVPESASMAVAILSITSLGIVASLFPFVNKLKGSFDLGMYFILVFSFVVASMADFSQFTFSLLPLLYYIVWVVFASFAIHAILAKIFKVDADNVIIVATSLACSPPFVPAVAGAIKNKELILSGITVGIIGYAIGNYLGIGIAFLLK